MQNDKLLPCPFCGSDKLKIDYKSTLIGYNGIDERVERWTFSVRCNSCHARGGTVGGKVIPFKYADVERKGITTKEELKDKCITSWNTRKPMERIVEQLEEYEDLYTQNKSSDDYELGQFSICERVIDILKKGGVDNATN